MLKYNRAYDHEEEVAEFFDVLDKCSHDVFAILPDCHAAVQAVATPVQAAAAAHPTPKPSTSELKLDKLAHDASMANYPTWMKQFRAYFDAGHLDTLPCMQQQAYLNNCLDNVLCAWVNNEASGTTPIYSPAPGLVICINILDSTFLESNPIHLRRKQFFDARQREGRTVIEFREELLSLIEEADGDNIGVNDLICMMLQIGVSEQALERELGSIKNPMLPAFNDKLEGYEQARKMVSHSAFGLAAKGNPKPNQHSSAQKGAQCSIPPRGNGKCNRRLALRGKCFHCARKDHLLPQCSYPATVKCNTNSGSGHISPACGRRQSANIAQLPALSAPSLPYPTQLAIGYDGQSFPSASSSVTAPADGAPSTVRSPFLHAQASFTLLPAGPLQKCLCD